MIIGGVMSLSNLYVGHKTGWGMGVTITACVLAFSLFKAIQVVANAKIFDGLPKPLLDGFRAEFSVLENNAMQSAASAAGYMATAGLSSSVPALMLTTGQRLSSWQLGAWIGGLDPPGAIMGMRTALSMLMGAIAFFCIGAPMLIDAGVIPASGGYRELVKWSMWPGASIMLTSGLLVFFLPWKTIVRAFANLANAFKAPDASAADDPLAQLEVPGQWFLWGFLVLGVVCVALEYAFFAIPIWMGILSVLLSLLWAIVASRATADRDLLATNREGGRLDRLRRKRHLEPEPASKRVHLR